MLAHTIVPLVKAGTGVDGLDEVLDGGYPAGRTTVVRGGPGSGKTLLGLQFLLRGTNAGLPGMFVTFEENVSAVRTNAATLGWNLPALEAKGLLFIHHAKLDPGAVTSGAFSLGGMMAILQGKARAMGAQLLVIDAVDILMRRFRDSTDARDQLSALHDWLDVQQTTTLLSAKLNDDAEMATRSSFLEYMADCVLQLDHRVTDQISTRRLRVLKYRGSGFGSNEFPYVIGARGISLVSIASSSLGHRAMGEFQSSGNAELDDALGGGFRRSACVLIAGPSGSGKTTLVCTFVEAACARGDRVLYVSFEESPEALESAVRSCGIVLQPALDSGLLRLFCRLPESMGSDEHLFEHLEIIKKMKPDVVVIDAISSSERMGSGKAAFDYCMRLANACKERGITCVLVNQMRGSDYSEDLSGLGITSLVDTVVQLRFEPTNNEVLRSLVVRKARGCAHSARLHDMYITDKGFVLSRRGESGPSPRRARPLEPMRTPE